MLVGTENRRSRAVGIVSEARGMIERQRGGEGFVGRADLRALAFEALGADPAYPDAHVLLADVSLDEEEAAEHYERAVELATAQLPEGTPRPASAEARSYVRAGAARADFRYRERFRYRTGPQRHRRPTPDAADLLDELRRLLPLAPDEEAGVRAMLAHRLIEASARRGASWGPEDQEASSLVEEASYLARSSEGPIDAWISYARALLAHRLGLVDPERAYRAEPELRLAIARNPLIARVMLDGKADPAPYVEELDDHARAMVEEAMAYDHLGLAAWEEGEEGIRALDFLGDGLEAYEAGLETHL